MPGDNFSRRVARAATIGGSRNFNRQTPLSWYLAILLICVLGVGLIVYSRYEKEHPVTTVAAVVPPTKANLWEVGLDLDICGKVSNLPASPAGSEGITTNGAGIVTIEPGTSTDPSLYSGKNATLNAFLIGEDVSLAPTTLVLPPRPAATTTTTTVPKKGSTTTTSSSSTTSTTVAKKSSSSSTSTTTTTVKEVAPTYTNGGRCEGKKGRVEVEEWTSPTAKGVRVSAATAPGGRLKNGELITIAFLPKAAVIPKPASAAAIKAFRLSNPGGVAPAGVTTPTTAPTSTTSTTTTTPTSTTTKGTTKGSTKSGG